jgi:hypothetical protein
LLALAVRLMWVDTFDCETSKTTAPAAISATNATTVPRRSLTVLPSEPPGEGALGRVVAPGRAIDDGGGLIWIEHGLSSDAWRVLLVLASALAPDTLGLPGLLTTSPVTPSPRSPWIAGRDPWSEGRFVLWRSVGDRDPAAVGVAVPLATRNAARIPSASNLHRCFRRKDCQRTQSVRGWAADP